VKQQGWLHEESFGSENLDAGDHSLRQPTRECGPGAGPLQMVPHHWWYSRISHRRRYRALRLLARKSVR